MPEGGGLVYPPSPSNSRSPNDRQNATTAIPAGISSVANPYTKRARPSQSHGIQRVENTIAMVATSPNRTGAKSIPLDQAIDGIKEFLAPLIWIDHGNIEV